MDGLPIEEDTGLEFSSENKNMHAWGHDAIRQFCWRPQNLLLKRHESEINGMVRLLFQPGREWPGGAEPMVKDGVMENPKVGLYACPAYNEKDRGALSERSRYYQQ